MVNPFFWVRFIDRDNFRQIRLRKRYLKMQRSSSGGEAQQQCARRILVLRIIFDDFRFRARVSDFLFADVAFNRAAKSVAAEFKFARRQLPLDFR